MSSRVVIQARRDVRHRVVVACWFCFVAAGAVAVLASRAAGQQPEYDQIKMHPAFEKDQVVKRMEAAARVYATTRDAEGYEDKQYATVYFSRYVPTKITQSDATAEVSTLVGEAMDLLSRAQRSGAPASQEILVALFQGMRPVAEGNYHPAARINAVLALGRMNLRVADRAAGRPPVPLPNAYPVLFGLYQDESAPDGVRAAALQGLLRHAKLRFPEMSDEQRTALASAMNELLESEAPEGRSPEAHAYLQRFAVDILAALRAPDDSSLGERLVAISTENERPDLIALYSAARLGKFNGDLGEQVGSPATILEKWSARALAAFRDEIKRLEALERPEPARNQPPAPDTFLQLSNERQQARTGGGMGPMGGPMGEMGMGGGPMGSGYDMMAGPDSDMMMQMEMEMGGMGMGLAPGMMMQREAKPQPPEVLISRRKLNYVLQQLQQGVTGAAELGVPREPGGLLAAVDNANRPVVEKWLGSIEKLVTALNDEMLDDREKYLEALREQQLVLEDLAGDEAETVEPLEEAGGQGEPAPALAPGPLTAPAAPANPAAPAAAAAGNPAAPVAQPPAGAPASP